MLLWFFIFSWGWRDHILPYSNEVYYLCVSISCSCPIVKLVSGRPRGSPNRHQPNEKPIKFRRGEGGEEWRGGPLWSPASCSLCSPDELCQPNRGMIENARPRPVGT